MRIYKSANQEWREIIKKQIERYNLRYVTRCTVQSQVPGALTNFCGFLVQSKITWQWREDSQIEINCPEIPLSMVCRAKNRSKWLQARWNFRRFEVSSRFICSCAPFQKLYISTACYFSPGNLRTPRCRRSSFRPVVPVHLPRFRSCILDLDLRMPAASRMIPYRGDHIYIYK